MAVLPLAEIAARRLLGTGIPGSQPIVQHLTLWVGFLGAALAAREGRLLALATTDFLRSPRLRRAAAIAAAAVGSAVAVLLARASLDLVVIERQAETMVTGGVPAWMAQLVLPLAFAAIALRLVWRAAADWGGRGIAALGLVAGALVGQYPALLAGRPAWPGLLLVGVATALGAPLFAALGGAAVLLFLAGGVPIAAVPAETYRLAVSPTLPAVPLFTLAGFLLAEGNASRRLLRLFRAWFGWVPGGTALVCTLVCAFFTVFTGGSGVTILAIGALLYQALLADGYPDRFAIGLITSAACLGLLFPPALPMILYGIVAQTPIEDLFKGGLLPGILLLGVTSAWGVRQGLRLGRGGAGAARTPFTAREAAAAVWEAKWELLLPILVVVAIFGGFATLVEASALTAVYAGIVQVFVHRDLKPGGDLLRVLWRCALMVGGVLVILGVAVGFTSYLVDAQVPARLLEWTRANVDSRLAFLLGLNLFLLVVGCLMDIFSAIVVVVPLIAPLGAAFGVHPVHLGVIFIANLELGYLTPPVGLNLFLASYRFERPMLEVYRATAGILVVRALAVLAVTYLPILSTALLAD